jgi:NAD+ synthase (glutamine-hydrolysing)
MSERLQPLRLALAQVDTRVGDLEGNSEKIRAYVERARDAGAELVLFPELALTGYPPEDLLLKEHFLLATQDALAELAAGVEGIVAVVGFPERTEDVFNSVAVIADGAVQTTYSKARLWNYGVADEERYFQAGAGAAVIDLGGARIGLTICEDIWVPGRPASDEAEAGASLIVNPSASPYHKGKGVERERMLIQRARDNLAAVAFCNLIGGQDELIFDGHSLLIDHEGTVLARAPQSRRRSSWRASTSRRPSPRACATRACGGRRTPRCRTCATAGGSSAPRPSRWRSSAATSRRCSSPRPRSTPRCAWACATTWRRTASSTWSSACRAGSTPR